MGGTNTISATGAELLTRFMGSKGLTAAEIAIRLQPSVSPEAVTRWAAGTRRPKLEARKQLAVITDGEVQVESWLSKAEQERAKAKELWLKKHPPPSTTISQ